MRPSCDRREPLRRSLSADGAHVHGDEGVLGALARGVERLGGQFLARATLTSEKNGQTVLGSEPRDGAAHVLDGVAGSKEPERGGSRNRKVYGVKAKNDALREGDDESALRDQRA